MEKNQWDGTKSTSQEQELRELDDNNDKSYRKVQGNKKA